LTQPIPKQKLRTKLSKSSWKAKRETRVGEPSAEEYEPERIRELTVGLGKAETLINWYEYHLSAISTDYDSSKSWNGCSVLKRKVYKKWMTLKILGLLSIHLLYFSNDRPAIAVQLESKVRLRLEQIKMMLSVAQLLSLRSY